jgi:hypothetical protein
MSEAPPVPQKKKKKGKNEKTSRASLRVELSVFFLFLGVLFAVAAYFSYTSLQGDFIPLWGLRRDLAISIPLGVIAILHLISGLLVAVIPHPNVAVVGGVASVLPALFYYSLMITVLGQAPINLIALLLITTPIIVWSRVAKYLSSDEPIAS